VTACSLESDTNVLEKLVMCISPWEQRQCSPLKFWSLSCFLHAILWGGVMLSSWVMWPLKNLLCWPQVIDKWVQSVDGLILDKDKRVPGETLVQIPPLHIPNSMWTAVRSNLRLHREQPVTNCFSWGMAMWCMSTKTYSVMSQKTVVWIFAAVKTQLN
jgi:hypothetical protein